MGYLCRWRRTVVTRSEMGSDLRARRRARGMTQARLADTVGVRPLVLGRWERGEAAPTRDQIRLLVEILDVNSATATSWAESAGRTDRPEPSTVVRIVQALGGSDPWGDLPSPIVTTPQKDRRRWPFSFGRRSAGGAEDSIRSAAPPRSVGVTKPAPHPRLTSQPDGDARPPPVRRVTETPYMDDPEQQRVYTVRSALTLVVLGALALALVWAVGELSDGWGAFLDLFRGGDLAGDPTDALGLIRLR